MSNRTKENYREIYKKYHSDVDISGLHIHHLDGDSNNNDISNLIALTQEDHYKIHFFQRDFGAASLLSAGIDAEAPVISVRKYDLDGYFIEEYSSISEAGEKNHPESLTAASFSGAITMCCKYRQKSVGGFQWFYTDEVGDLDYVGPIEAQPKGGHSTKSHEIIINGIKYKSKADAAKKLFPEYADRTDGGQLRKEFKQLLIENGYE